MSQLSSNQVLSIASVSWSIGLVFANQMVGLPHLICLGSLYNCFTVTTDCAPIHSFHAGKKAMPPRISSNTAYSAASISRAMTSPLTIPIVYT